MADKPVWRRVAGLLIPPLIALTVAWGFIAYRSPYHGSRLFNPASFARYDSGQYLQIARHGYWAMWNCGKGHRLPPHMPPGDYLCGNVGWFPGYPAAMRGLSSVTGMPIATAGLVVAWACWYLALLLMWRLLAGARSAGTRWICLLIAAFFSGQIYFAALFPISLCTAGILACLYLSLRSARAGAVWGAFASAFVAAASYLSAIVLAPALLITGSVAWRDRRRKQSFVPALGAVAGLGAVFVTMQVWVGIWDAYFWSQKKYGLGTHFPLEALVSRLRPLWTSQSAKEQFQNTTAAQTLVTMCFVGFAVLVTAIWSARHRVLVGSEESASGVRPPPSWYHRLSAAIESRISPFDWTFLLMAIGVWVLPYIAGGVESTYRPEAFAIVCVPLLRRLPAWLLLVPLGAAVFVAWRMAPFFFSGTLQ